MPRLTRAVTPDEIAAYQHSGVVLLRGALDNPTVEALRHLIDEATDTLNESAAGYNLSAVTRASEAQDDDAIKSLDGGQYDASGLVGYIKASGHPMLLDNAAAPDAKGSFLLDTGVAARLAAFRQFCVGSALPQIAGELLRANKINFYQDQIFVKQPQTRERTAYHQDTAYFEIEGDQCCTMWIPVDPVTVENGGMRYVRGSHRGPVYAPNLFISNARMPGSEGPQMPDIDADPAAYDLVHFDVEPGDIVVHHCKTIHGAGGNLSHDRKRRAASVRYCGEDIRFRSRPGVPPQLHNLERLQDGDRLRAPNFPLVWQRSSGAVAA